MVIEGMRVMKREDERREIGDRIRKAGDVVKSSIFLRK